MNLTAQLLEPEVRELIREGRYGELREALHGIPPPDVAEILGELSPAEAAVGFRFLIRDDAGDVFSYFPPQRQEELIAELGAEGSLRVIEAMEPDDRVKLLDELPAEVAQRIVASLSPENRRVTQAILGYEPGSVGRLMTPDYVKIRPEWTVAQALDHIRRTGRDAETVNVVYVVDDQGKLIDDVRLRQLLFAEPNQTVESVRGNQFVALRADQDQEEAVRQMSRYDRLALPVTDSRGVLVGIVTGDDVADVAEQEVTEDIQKLAGMAALDEPYLRTGHMEMFRKRGFWLGILFVGQSITILVLGAFQREIEKAAVLAIFMPLVISCGGNSGSQAAALVTRALALDEIGMSDWWRIVRRELLTALMLASALAALGFVSTFIFNRVVLPAMRREATAHILPLSFTVAFAVGAVVVWGTLLGSILPLLLKRAGIDPAAASSPMVATLMDASGTLIYFGIALGLLSGSIL